VRKRSVCTARGAARELAELGYALSSEEHHPNDLVRYARAAGEAGFSVGAARVYRVVPGKAPTVFADGFTNIIDIAFRPDRSLGPLHGGPSLVANRRA
jgi:hypothetical protein